MGLFSGFNINPLKNKSTLGGFATGGIFGAALGAKNSHNAKIDEQIAGNQGMKQPGLLDPNDIGQPQAGGSAYLKLQHSLNAQDATRSMEQATQGAMGNAGEMRSTLAGRGGVNSGASLMASKDAMNAQAAQRQIASSDLSRANTQAGIADEGFRRNAYNQMRMHNQETQGRMWSGQQMENAEAQKNKKTGLLGLGFLGL